MMQAHDGPRSRKVGLWEIGRARTYHAGPVFTVRAPVEPPITLVSSSLGPRCYSRTARTLGERSNPTPKSISSDIRSTSL